jgi:hypothetical protein
MSIQKEESSGHFLADSNGNVTMSPKSGGGMWDFLTGL